RRRRRPRRDLHGGGQRPRQGVRRRLERTAQLPGLPRLPGRGAGRRRRRQRRRPRRHPDGAVCPRSPQGVLGAGPGGAGQLLRRRGPGRRLPRLRRRPNAKQRPGVVKRRRGVAVCRRRAPPGTGGEVFLCLVNNHGLSSVPAPLLPKSRFALLRFWRTVLHVSRRPPWAKPAWLLRRNRPGTRSFRPQLEALENRLAPATFNLSIDPVVNNAGAVAELIAAIN